MVFDDVTAIGTNTVRILGEIDNNCAFTVVNGDFSTTGIIVCPVAVSQDGTDGLSFPPLGVGQRQFFQEQLDGWCEGCTNHVPDVWPPFDIVLEGSAVGQNAAGNITVVSNQPQSVVHGMPNSSNFSIPC